MIIQRIFPAGAGLALTSVEFIERSSLPTVFWWCIDESAETICHVLFWGVWQYTHALKA